MHVRLWVRQRARGAQCHARSESSVRLASTSEVCICQTWYARLDIPNAGKLQHQTTTKESEILLVRLYLLSVEYKNHHRFA
jgi:hypothetical protein